MRASIDEDFCDVSQSSSRRKHRQRLAALNILHSKKIHDSSALNIPEHPTSSISKQREDLVLPLVQTSLIRSKRRRSTGRRVIFSQKPISLQVKEPSSDEKKNYEKKEEKKEQILVSCPQMDENDEDMLPKSKRSVRMQFYDACALLRCDFKNEMEFDTLKNSVLELLSFLNELRSFAKSMGVLEGTVFQELLSIFKNDHRNLSHKMSMNVPELKALVPQAQQLIALLRIKVEDDGDLNLARKALRETRMLLEGIKTMAKKKNMEEMDIVKSFIR